MVYDASLGYDPDEWEECPEVQHFLVFSLFTRIFMSVFAVGFVYIFFKLIKDNKNKEKDEGEEAVGGQAGGETVISQIGQKLQQVYQSYNQPEPDYSVPASADDLLREADEYLKKKGSAISSAGSNMGQRLEEVAQKAKEGVQDVYHKVEQKAEELFRSAETSHPLGTIKEGIRQNQHYDTEEQWEPARVQYQQQQQQQQQYQQQPHQYQQHQDPNYIYQQMPDDQFGSLHRRQPQLRASQERRTLSAEEERELREWELEKERMEADRLARLQDRMVGGEESEFSTDSRAIEQLLPASHISYHSQSPDEQPSPLPRQDETPVLEKKLRAEIDQLAVAQHQTKNRESYRDSELTDYDISDFHVHEPYDLVGAPASDVRFIPGRVGEAPAPLTDKVRHTTGDSDDYEKVQPEPLFEEPEAPVPPPRRQRDLSNEEAKRLQELCHEYDFGMDIGVQPPIPVTTPANSPEVQPPFTSSPFQAIPPKQTHHIHVQPTSEEEAFQKHQASPFGAIGDHRPQPLSHVAAPQDIRKQDEVQHIVFKTPGQETTRNLAAAELYVQDALEYLGQHETGPSTGFVMEEEMLSSHGGSNKKAHAPRLATQQSAEQATSKMVFDRMEHDEHDDVTYAPEIQSVEIPPDQMSENSENLQDYFDRVAAEGGHVGHVIDIRKQQETQGTRQIPIQIQQRGMQVPQAPQMVPVRGAASSSSIASGLSSDGYPKLRKQTSLLSVLGVTSMQEMLLTITSLDDLSNAMRKAGLESTNVIFGIDYTASNKYQGEESFHGRSLHTIHPNIKNPYQQVITILGHTLAPFASTSHIPVFGFGDAKTGDWSTFPLKSGGHCETLDEVLKVYNEVTPSVDLSGPTNFAPLIYQAMEICQKANDYHILVIIADGQVTNERATRRAIVQACQYPLSIIVVGVGDGPWDMMRVFDESLPKRPWDNFHFVEFHEIMKKAAAAGLEEGEVKLAVQSLLEIPDQYRCICELGLLRNRDAPTMRGSDIKREIQREHQQH